MAEISLSLEEVFALPELSIQTYLQFKGWPSRNFLADRLVVIIYYANDGWLGDADRALVRLEDFTITATLSDAELITRLQERGEEVTALMTRFDLARTLLTIGIESGNLYSFGHNRFGQLGLGNTGDRDVPTPVTVSSGLKVKAVSCGSDHTVIITEDGNLYSFGYNLVGQLGLGGESNRVVATVVSVPDDLKVKAVSCGADHTAIITEDGNLHSFGINDFGQLGLGDEDVRDIPTLVTIPGDLKVKAVSCGGVHTVIITEDGNLYSFGFNYFGQLGLGDTTERNVPMLVNVPNGSKVKVVGCGDDHTIIITENGALYSFGRNESGQLGLDDGDDRNRPVLVNVPGGLKVKAVSCGNSHTVIITEDDNLYSFGDNFSGQLGLGDDTNRIVATLVSVPSGLRVKAVSCGDYYTVIITGNDNLYSFGNNGFGQLGLGDEDIRDIPTLVNISGISRVIAASCGKSYTVVIAK